MAGGSSTYQLTGTGSTEALIFPQPTHVMHKLQHNHSSTIWGYLDSPSVLTYSLEASPDGTAWVPIVGFIDLVASKFSIFSGYCFAIRGTVTAYTSGKFTLFANWTM